MSVPLAVLEANKQAGNLVRSRPANEGFWGVVLLAIAMLAVIETSGNKPGPGFYLALLLYVAIGGIYPPIGLAVGGVILLKLLLVHGQNVGQTLTNVTSGTNKLYVVPSVAGSPAQGGVA